MFRNKFASIAAVLFVLFLVGVVSEFAARDRSVPVASWPRVESCPPYPPAKTGQVDCFDTSGSAIPCDGTGHDGEYRNGSMVNPRYRNNFDGTVRDNQTGLTWLRDANCFGLRDWEDALSDANTLSSGFCGLTDGSVEGEWRLPNVAELQSLLDRGQSDPALPLDHPFFEIQADSYWTSTSLASFTGGAWYVSFDYGKTDSIQKTGTRYVWPVRDSE